MKRLYLATILLVLAMAGLFSLLASEAPDGLETTLDTYQVPEQPFFQAPLADYQIPVVEHQILRRSLAGISGALLVAAIAMLVSFFLTRKRSGRASPHR